MMSKQSAIILILVVFFGALGALIYFYISVGNTTPRTVIIPATTDIYDPFGTKSTDNNFVPNTPDTTTEIVATSSATSTNLLRQISTDPESGYSLVDNLKTKQTDVHYILRFNGNIYETYAQSEESKRLSMTTIQKVYESTWLPDGVRLIIRYLKDGTESIETFSVKINPATTTANTFEGGVDGNFLPENINTLAVNPIGDKLFYVTSGLNGSSGYISKPDGLNKKLLFESPLNEWLTSWPKEETLTLTTKPSAKIAGYMYFLNSKTGDFSRILGGIFGLTTKTNKTATEVLYSDSVATSPNIYLYNIKGGESKLLTWSTLPEKCLWSNTNAKTIYCAVPKNFPAGDYPDVWYKGLVNFTDDIWMIDTDTMTATLVYDIQKETSNRIDAIDLQLDKNDNYLFFTNKTDLTLWSLKLI